MLLTIESKISMQCEGKFDGKNGEKGRRKLSETPRSSIAVLH
jgi:hypothetical protein